jgi:hypothetical protein
MLSEVMGTFLLGSIVREESGGPGETRELMG